MTSRTTSPRRRHILSSINPETDDARSGSSKRRRTSRSPSKRHESEDTESRGSRRKDDGEARSHRAQDDDRKDKKRDYGDEQRSDDELRPRSKKFRFKKRSHRERDRSKEPSTSSRSHRSRRRHHRSRSPTPTNPHEPRALSPDTAFRESLFDAMADDEGAAYWEGVYGQPVHVYASEATGPTGELEQMNDEEYATYVRRRMWEKTHEGMLEEQAARREARKKEKEEAERLKREARRDERVRRELEESLRRGEERRGRKARKARWEGYLAGWKAWDARETEELPWPTEDGRREGVRDGEAVRRFFVEGLEGEDKAARLREERVRWHPDKIQARAEGGKVDNEVLADVTAVFQVVDGLWGEYRR
jgi:hypothetical protein